MKSWPTKDYGSDRSIKTEFTVLLSGALFGVLGLFAWLVT